MLTSLTMYVCLLAALVCQSLLFQFGLTSLHIACHNGSTEIVNLLLAVKAKLNLQTKEGKTPLFEAAMAGHSDIVKQLLSKKTIKVNLANNVTDSMIVTFAALTIAVEWLVSAAHRLPQRTQ